MIPNILHFCWGFSTCEFGVLEYLAIKSAIDHNKPDAVYLYHRLEIQSPWWDKIKDQVKCVRITPPKQIFGQTITDFRHQSDIIRLLALIDMGGIYLDMDTISLKPLKDLSETATLQLYFQKCCRSPIILCENHNAALIKLRDSHTYPNETSPERPTLDTLPNKILDHPLMSAVFNSNKEELLSRGHIYHFNASLTHDKWLNQIDEKYIQEVENNFTRIARRHIKCSKLVK